MTAFTDEELLRRAIRLAMKGRGRVEPNPMVGCIITQKGRIIGSGFHEQFGGPHAEPNALAACTEDPRGGTAYITLEPCCHEGKKTPPCVPQLIEAGLSRIVIGCLDPNPAVNGQGVAMLRAAGITVDGPLLESEARQLIAPFIAQVSHQRPYVTLKWAQSEDGKVAGPGGQTLRLSGERAWHAVHELRARCDAILIGTGTAVSDDPLLTPRRVQRLRPRLLRIVLDSHLRLSAESRLATTVDMEPTIVFCLKDACDPARAKALRDLRVEVVPVEGEGRVPLPAVMAELHRRQVMHLLVEPGPTLARSFFDANLVDRLWVIRTAKSVGDDSAPAAAEIPADYVETGQLALAPDVLVEQLNPRSPVYFTPQASADFLALCD